MRVHSDHWAILLDFCEDNKEIITNKVIGPRGRNDLNDKWNLLVIQLNSLGHGEKTKEEWKKTLTDWKSKTKSKAAEIIEHSKKTGGGTITINVLSENEKRLLALMGKTSFLGNPGIPEMGVRKRQLSINNDQAMRKVVKTSRESEQISVFNIDEYLLPKVHKPSTSKEPINTNKNLLPEVHRKSITSNNFGSILEFDPLSLSSTEHLLLNCRKPSPSSNLNNTNNTQELLSDHDYSNTPREEIVPVHKHKLESIVPLNTSTPKKNIKRREIPVTARKSTMKNNNVNGTQFVSMHNDLLEVFRGISGHLDKLSCTMEEISSSLKTLKL